MFRSSTRADAWRPHIGNDIRPRRNELFRRNKALDDVTAISWNPVGQELQLDALESSEIADCQHRQIHCLLMPACDYSISWQFRMVTKKAAPYVN
jgi:hypothetical protein